MGELKQRGSVWWVRYYRNGRRYEESSGSIKKDDARRLLRLREGDVARGVPITPQVGRLKFDEAAQDVVNDYKVNSKRSLPAVEGRLKLHLEPFFGGHRMTAITTADVRKFSAKRQAAGASNAEVNRELAILKRAYSLAVQAGKLLARPHIPMLAESNVRTGFFERQEFEDVRDRLPEHLRGLVTFLYLSGWRSGEVVPLEWRQVDRKVGTVRLDPGATKNGEGRLFPYGELLPELHDVIETQWTETKRLEQDRGVIVPLVFHRRGEAIRDFRHAWSSACEAAGVPGRIPHDFRRTAVRNLERAGVSRSVAMKLTGHLTESVYRRYAIVSEADLSEGLAKLADLATGTEKGQSASSARVSRLRRSS